MNTPALPSLKAMAENKVDGVSKMTIFTVDPNAVLFEEGFNLREEGPELDAHLEALYQAMKAGASVPPIDVSVINGTIIARDGHCRTRVARRLVAEGVPYLLQARQFRGNDAECVFHMISSAQGKSLTPLEAGRGFLRLLRYNMTVADIVRRTGLSRTTVDNGVTLAESPAALQKMISSGQVSVAVALGAIKSHGDKAAEHLQTLVAEVQQTKGGQKVTTKHVNGQRVPQKVVQAFVSASKSLHDCMNQNYNMVMLNDMEDDETVAMPVKIVRELLAAHNELEPKDEL